MKSHPSSVEVASRQISNWQENPANLLQILIGIQQELNHIPEEARDVVATKMSLSPAVVDGVISFYSFLHTRPRGQFDIQFSDNIVDRMLGGRKLAARLATALGMEIDTTRGDGHISIGMTSCTGMGDQGPAALVNGHTLTALTPERIDHIASMIEAETPLGQWPTEYFAVQENLQRQDILLARWYSDGSATQAVTNQGADAYLEELERSGLRGRGGAGFKTALKWRFCKQAPGDHKVVVCNADEGEPGTFKDRLLLQSYADRLFEGMTACAAAIGADMGFVYLRGEYLYLLDELNTELQRRRDAGLLGESINGQTGFDFDIHIHLGAGAYICGEESALIESLEGKRGVPRIRPPFPVTHGYLGRPTVVNNVETFIAAAGVAVNDADWFLSRGTEESTGTKLLSVSGDCAKPGIYEFPFGVTINEVLDTCGASDTYAVQIAGPAGQLIPASDFERKIAFEDIATGGSFMIFDQSRDILDIVTNFADFFVHESCGFCTPCRVGTSLIQKRLRKIAEGNATNMDLNDIREVAGIMQTTSHCGLGQTAANPAVHAIERFYAEFESKLRSTTFEPDFDLDAALAESRDATGRDDPGAHLHGGGV